MNSKFEEAKNSLKSIDPHPSLEAVLKDTELDRTRLLVGLKVDENDRPDCSIREDVLITDGTNSVLWRVASLKELFRGVKQPPSMSGEPPPFYMPMFYFIEQHALTFCGAFGDKTDDEFEEVYRQLRRRPDGRAFNELHFFLWQVLAGLLGKRPVSAAEFEAILDRLQRSARTFRMGPVSRNYITTLRQTNASSGV
jgi:hypothetical protein